MYSLILGGLLFYLYYSIGQIKVVAEFKDLEPFRGRLPIYYKGFRLGHTGKVYPGPDFTTTRVVLKLRLKGLELPENTTIMIRRKDKKDYMELEYPSSPYLAILKHNSLIEGEKGLNFESFIQDQASNGGLDAIKNNVNETIMAAGGTVEALTEMINVMTKLTKCGNHFEIYACVRVY